MRLQCFGGPLDGEVVAKNGDAFRHDEGVYRAGMLRRPDGFRWVFAWEPTLRNEADRIIAEETRKALAAVEAYRAEINAILAFERLPWWKRLFKRRS